MLKHSFQACALLSLLVGLEAVAQQPLTSSPPPPPPSDPCLSRFPCEAQIEKAGPANIRPLDVPGASPMAFVAVGDGVGDNSSNVYYFSYFGGITALTSLGEAGVILWDIAIDPYSGILYAISQGKGLYTINWETGAATLVGNTGYLLNSLEFCWGVLFGWGDNVLVTINTATGQATRILSQIPDSTLGNPSGDLMCSMGGVLYGIARRSSGNDDLLVFNTIYGFSTWTGITFPVAKFFGGEIDGEDNMYVARPISGGIELRYVDRSAGTTTVVGAHSTTFGINGMAMSTATW